MNNEQAKVSIVTSMEGLSSSAVELLKNESSPFLNYQWFSAFCSQVCPSLGEQKWLVLSENEQAIAILPMFSYTRGKYKILRSMTNYYSPYFSPISSDANQGVHLDSIVEKAGSLFHQYDLIEILPVTDFIKKQFTDSFVKIGWASHCYSQSKNWRELEINYFTEYWEQRPSILRSTVARKGKKLDNIEHEFKIYSEQLPDQALADYHRVYFNSWKIEEPFPTFIDEIIRATSKNNRLRLGLLYINGLPVATQLWIVAESTAYIVKLAYDAKYKALSVGSLLSYRLFKHVIEHDKVTTIDYLTGDDSYKPDWTSNNRNLYGIEIANKRTTRGLVSKIKNSSSELFQLLSRKT